MVCLAVLSVWLCASAAPAFAQARSSHAYPEDEPDCDDPQVGHLTIDADERGFNEVALQVCFDARREVELRQKLPVALGCPPNTSAFSLYKFGKIDALEVDCEIPLPRKGLQHFGQIELVPIQDALKDAEVTGLTLNLWVPLFGTAHCDPERPQSFFPKGRECSYVLNGTPDDPSVVRFSFGYDDALVARIISILGLLLAIPIAITFWFRRRTLNVPEESKPGIVFAYRRFITWTALGGLLIWWTAIDLLHADDFAAFLTASANSKDDAFATFLLGILVWLPPAIMYFVCLALSSPIHSLRGMTRTQGQAVSQSFWSVARVVLPLSLFILGAAELFNRPRIGVLLFAAAIFAARFINQQLARSYGMQLQALTSGELRDRAFALARKAGAKLNQLYVLPAERMRLANAFAHSANNIFLTDYLLKNLNKREVDAIVGHEMAHLQKKHIRWRILIFIAAGVAVICAAIWLERWIPPNFPVGPLVYGCFLFVAFFVSRRNEFSADAGAVKLTGDAEAMITGLARISRLNTMPIHWGKLDEKMLTHPSTLRRMARLARAGGISEARIPELLSESAAPPTDVYPIPATALPAGKIFSTQFKARLSWISFWTTVLAAAIVPTLVALAIQWTHVSGAGRSIAYMAGVFLSLACYLTIANFLPKSGTRELEARLGEKLKREGAPQGIRGGLFVSLAPDSSPRIYEGNWAWDVGFLAASQNGLSYWGEEARFTLRPEQITRILLGPGPVGWFSNQSVYLTWQNDAGRERVFNLRPLQTRSMLKMAHLTRQLLGDLENWRRGIPLPAGSLLSNGHTESRAANSLGSPAFGQVTSLSPQALGRRLQLVRMYLSDTFIAVGVAILFGLRFPTLDAIAPSSGPRNLNSSGRAVLYILATVWITRAFQLWPFWRFRETSVRPGPTAVSPAPAR